MFFVKRKLKCKEYLNELVASPPPFLQEYKVFHTGTEQVFRLLCLDKARQCEFRKLSFGNNICLAGVVICILMIRLKYINEPYLQQAPFVLTVCCGHREGLFREYSAQSFNTKP